MPDFNNPSTSFSDEDMQYIYQQIQSLSPSDLAEYYDEILGSIDPSLIQTLQEFIQQSRPDIRPDFLNQVSNTVGSPARQDIGQFNIEPAALAVDPVFRGVNPVVPGGTGGGGGGTGGTTTPPPLQEYPFMFSQDMLRGLADESLGGIRGLKAKKQTPFDFSSQQNPAINDTLGLMNQLVQRYRGI